MVSPVRGPYSVLSPAEVEARMSDPCTLDGQSCPSCGLIGSPHASDGECVAALRSKVEQINTFVESVLKQSARRRQFLPAPVKERVEGSLSEGRLGDSGCSVPRNPRLRVVRSQVAIQL